MATPKENVKAALRNTLAGLDGNSKSTLVFGIQGGLKININTVTPMRLAMALNDRSYLDVSTSVLIELVLEVLNEKDMYSSPYALIPDGYRRWLKFFGLEPKTPVCSYCNEEICDLERGMVSWYDYNKTTKTHMHAHSFAVTHKNIEDKACDARQHTADSWIELNLLSTITFFVDITGAMLRSVNNPDFTEAQKTESREHYFKVMQECYSMTYKTYKEFEAVVITPFLLLYKFDGNTGMWDLRNDSPVHQVHNISEKINFVLAPGKVDK